MTGNQLRALRERLGWTQQELADYWEIDRVTIGLYEGRGDAELPRSKMFDILGDALEKKTQKIGAAACKALKKAIDFVESQTEVLASVPGENGQSDFINGLKKLAADLKAIVW
jgi:transcriptional regulator with XRE-family HTH domain